jgi:hypothetical protein
VLSKENYHVLHFDLRIAGFADLSSLYFSLSQQMELYFEEIASTLPGYGEFEKEAWTFKVTFIAPADTIGILIPLSSMTVYTWKGGIQISRTDKEKSRQAISRV